MRNALNYRNLFITSKGYIGLAQYGVRSQDLIYVLCGARVPYILRSTKSEVDSAGAKELISEAYVHGIMYGEAVDYAAAEGRQAEPVILK